MYFTTAAAGAVPSICEGSREEEEKRQEMSPVALECAHFVPLSPYLSNSTQLRQN
jgi:hypothetical protein